MAVVHAEARAAAAGTDPVTLPASTSSAVGTRRRRRRSRSPAAARSLRAWGLPAPGDRRAYRVWLLDGAAPRVPRPGPLLGLDARRGREVELGGARRGRASSWSRSEGAQGAPRGRPVLRVRLPPGVTAARRPLGWAAAAPPSR